MIYRLANNKSIVEIVGSTRATNLVARQSSVNLKTALIDIKIELRLKYAYDNCLVDVKANYTWLRFIEKVFKYRRIA